MPPKRVERKTLRQIASEFEKLARGLRNYPSGEAGPRTAAPSRAILSSLKRVNATLASGAEAGRLGPARFRSLSREFKKMGAALQKAGAAAKTGRAKRAPKRAPRKRAR